MKIRILTLATICVLASGCTTVVFESTRPDGAKVKTTYRTPAFGSRQFGDIDLTKGTVKGVRSDQSQMAEVIAQGVALGLSKARP